MMPKSDTIAAIAKLSPSVDEGFLSEFSDTQLTAYLGRLEDVADSHITILPAQHAGTPRAGAAGAVTAIGI